MTNKIRLSKSRFTYGYQCHLRLWNDVHAPELADETNESLRAIFDTGHKVGELACKRYPNGRLIEHDHHHFDDAVTETNELLKDETILALFEAAFEYEGLIARADIIERRPEGGWKLIEVKSATKPKEINIWDFVFQLHILRNTGLDVREGGVLTLVKSYVYDGEKLDLEALFQLHDVFDYSGDVSDSVLSLANQLQSVIFSDEPPEVEPGNHCFTPYTCPFLSHCHKKPPRRGPRHR